MVGWLYIVLQCHTQYIHGSIWYNIYIYIHRCVASSGIHQIPLMVPQWMLNMSDLRSGTIRKIIQWSIDCNWQLSYHSSNQGYGTHNARGLDPSHQNSASEGLNNKSIIGYQWLICWSNKLVSHQAAKHHHRCHLHQYNSHHATPFRCSFTMPTIIL